MNDRRAPLRHHTVRRVMHWAPPCPACCVHRLRLTIRRLTIRYEDTMSVPPALQNGPNQGCNSCITPQIPDLVSFGGLGVRDLRVHREDTRQGSLSRAVVAREVMEQQPPVVCSRRGRCRMPAVSGAACLKWPSCLSTNVRKSAV